jgi:hypothetical protein
MWSASRRLARWVCIGSCLWSVGCAAVYPEMQAPLRGADGRVTPPNPKNLRWIAFLGAVVPPETRDGRKWGGTLGTSTNPDPYAILFVNGRVLIKTPSQASTLAPTWPDAPAGNFRVQDTDRYRVELWDKNPVNDHPIGVKEVGLLSEEVLSAGEVDVECDTGAHVRVAFQPPRVRFGLGFYYELRVGEAFVTRAYEESPAGRAGVKPGDQIMALDGKPVSAMKAGEVQSIINTPHVAGLAMELRHANGQKAALELKEGPVYPLFSEMGTLR